MASIRKRKLPSGAVVWQADYRDRDGKRRAKQFLTRKAADEYLVTVRSDLRQGRHVAPGASITIDQAGELWMERAERDQLVRGTKLQYRQHLTHHISPTLGKVKLADLTAPRVYAFINDMLQTTSRATARKVLTSLGSLVEEAVRRGQAAHNPVRSVKMTKATAEQVASAELEMPTKEELRAILGAASGRWRPPVVTAMFTGMRGSELEGARPDGDPRPPDYIQDILDPNERNALLNVGRGLAQGVLKAVKDSKQAECFGWWAKAARQMLGPIADRLKVDETFVMVRSDQKGFK